MEARVIFTVSSIFLSNFHCLIGSLTFLKSNPCLCRNQLSIYEAFFNQWHPNNLRGRGGEKKRRAGEISSGVGGSGVRAPKQER
jgi:hypothetical protein